MPTQRYFSLLLIIIAIVLAGCVKKNPPPPQGAATVLSTIELSLLKDLELKKKVFNSHKRSLKGTGVRFVPGYDSILFATVTNSVSFYKATYPTTDIDGKHIMASGLVITPKYDGPLPVLSFQHGTLANPDKAPSMFNAGRRDHHLGALAASLGYIVVMPDYLGYGTTADTPHPYMHAATLARATTDMILAIRKLARNGTLQWDNRLYLAGYSEGGYATMATHRLLESKYADSLLIVAVSCGAGAYDITNTAKYFLTRDETRSPFYVRAHIWTMLTYNQLYPQLKRPVTNYVVAPYDRRIANNPLLSAPLALNPRRLMDASFKAAVLEGRDTIFLDALADNDIYNWKPQAPVLLVHSTGDSTVPILNSETAYNSFNGKGANVQYKLINGKSHRDAAEDFIFYTLLFFEQH